MGQESLVYEPNLIFVTHYVMPLQLQKEGSDAEILR
jgi:hypothetical protein